MRMYSACALLVCAFLELPAQAGNNVPFRVGAPAPLAPGVQAASISLRRPQPLQLQQQQQQGYDTSVRPAAYAPPTPAPTIRAKIDIPRVLHGTAVGLLPVMQGDPVEAGPPRSEEIPLMPKKLGNTVQEEGPEGLRFPQRFGTAEPPVNGVEPVPPTITMPYADGAPPIEGGIIHTPEGSDAPLAADGIYCGQPVPIGDGCCAPACNPCEPCCACTTRCWPRLGWKHKGCWGHAGCANYCDCSNQYSANYCDCSNQCACTNQCGCCDCYPRGKGWISAEYLLLHFNRQGVPPLLTTSNQDDLGILGRPSTTVLYGEDQLNDQNWRSGLRLSMGKWFRCNSCWGIDGSVFYLPRDASVFTRASGGNPLLARPYTNANDGAQDSVRVASLDEDISGVITIGDYSRLFGFDVNLRRKWCCGCNYHLDVLVGYRHLQLDEGIEIFDFEAFLANDETNIANDFFRTRNTFTGGQIGVDGEYRINNRWSLAGMFKLGIGSVRQTVSIFGFTDTTLADDTTQRLPGGILALNSNIGSYTRNRFAIAPELQLKLQYRLTDNWQAYVGYDILMISSVVRPGEQIDSTLDPDQFPGVGGTGTRPAVLFNTSTFIAQGVNFGLLCNY